MNNKAKRTLQGIIYASVFIIGLSVGNFLFGDISVWRDWTDASEAETSASEAAEIAVDYPFSSAEKGWSLVLRESIKEDVQDRDSVERRFCLYDGNGQLLQEFPCGIEAKEVVLRFDAFFEHYYNKDMVVYPADAQETGADGLCYQWDSKTQRFVEEPVTIPWYQEGSVRDEAFLVCGKGNGAEESVETKTIYRINERTREVVELRRWTVRGDAKTGEESLCIRDCLEEQDIYTGNVIRYDTGDLKNEKYYQYLFWEGLKTFWGDENDSPIRFCNEQLELIEYKDKQAFLADHGFAGAEPFYEYRDRFGNLIMELYFDQQAGRGCGICYYYSFNDKLEKRVTRDGFAFEEVETGVWEPQDTFSTRDIPGKYTEEQHWPREIYAYTTDGKLSSFEAKSRDRVDGVPMEVSLLSLDYIYRDDGTLYHKEYYHYPKFYGSTGYSKSGDYDEQGRLVYQNSYITHGEMDEYYIYNGNHTEPEYYLFLDWGNNFVYVRMIAYDSAD